MMLYLKWNLPKRFEEKSYILYALTVGVTRFKMNLITLLQREGEIQHERYSIECQDHPKVDIKV